MMVLLQISKLDKEFANLVMKFLENKRLTLVFSILNSNLWSMETLLLKISN